MAYNPDIPQTGDNLSTSQGQILGNFQALNTLFNLDHYAWNDSVSGNRGLHRKVDFPATTTVSAPSGLASVIYSKNVSSVASPYFDNASGSSVMWRGGSTNGLVSETLANPGQLNLPNGFQLRWGTDAFSGTNGTKTVTFTPAFTTNCLFATVVLEVTTPAVWVAAEGFANNQFLARRNSLSALSGQNFRWFALGY